MWTLQQCYFTQQCKISTKHNKKVSEGVDRIKAINKFKGYVQSVLPMHEHTLKSSVPAINSHVDNRLLEATIDVNQPLLQFVDGVDFTLVYTMLHDSPDLVINWIEIWTVWKPQIWRN